MAGEIEESLVFQADSLHSGSISFGRFEAESLCWERRSSFSHNRYLEEVEKYSTPGSVNQKKAYFEAHFKKKALLQQALSECQSGEECQSSENYIHEHMNYMEEFEHANEEIQFAQFDDSQEGSDYHADHKVACERGGEEISHSKCVIEPTTTGASPVLEGDPQRVDLGQKHQNQLESGTLVSCNGEPETEAELKLYQEAENVDELPKSTETSPESRRTCKDDNSRLKMPQYSSLRAKVTAETKTAKSKLSSQATICQVSRKIPGQVGMDSAKNPQKIEKESQLRTKTDKRLSQKIIPTISSPSKSMKPEDPENSKIKPSQENRSGRDTISRRKKMDTLPSASVNNECRVRQNVDRTRRNVTSIKPCTKPNAAIFNFKSDERAEKRKEFFMKLEERIHAKEVEMNQIQAKTQEEAEAQMKQFRRSLNFKATPMPSFYHESVAQVSDGIKIASNQSRSTKSQCKSTSPGSRSAAGSPALSKSQDQPARSSSEPADATMLVQTSERIHSPTSMNGEAASVSPTSTSRIRTGKRVEVRGKKERDKGKDTNLQKHQASDRKTKGERVDSRRTPGGALNNSPHGSDMVKKVMRRGVGIAGNSEVGHLAVHVAS